MVAPVRTKTGFGDLALTDRHFRDMFLNYQIDDVVA